MDKKQLEKCYKKNELLLQNLLSLLNEKFSKHLKFLESGIELQKIIIDVMWVLSQRFLTLTRGAICVRPYPAEPSDREERELREKFQIRKDELKKSNHKLSMALTILKHTCRRFDKSLTRAINPNYPNQFFDPTKERRSIYFYIDFYADFIKYLEDIQGKLKVLEKCLNIDDIKAILEYKKNSELDPVEIDYFKNSMSEPIHVEIKKCVFN